MLEWDRAVVRDEHVTRLVMQQRYPLRELVCIGQSCRQEDEARLLHCAARHDDALLPHHAALNVLQVVHLMQAVGWGLNGGNEMILNAVEDWVVQRGAEAAAWGWEATSSNTTHATSHSSCAPWYMGRMLQKCMMLQKCVMLRRCIEGTRQGSVTKGRELKGEGGGSHSMLLYISVVITRNGALRFTVTSPVKRPTCARCMRRSTCAGVARNTLTPKP